MASQASHMFHTDCTQVPNKAIPLNQLLLGESNFRHHQDGFEQCHGVEISDIRGQLVESNAETVWRYGGDWCDDAENDIGHRNKYYTINK